MNLARNIGGSVGVAVATTLLDRRTQVHQNMLVAHATPFDEAYRNALGLVTRAVTVASSSAVDATAHALGLLGRRLALQASMLATIDAFTVLACVYLVAIPLTFVLKRVRTEKGALAVH
jgi:DHA2 family multidrug resistance protein